MLISPFWNNSQMYTPQSTTIKKKATSSSNLLRYNNDDDIMHIKKITRGTYIDHLLHAWDYI